MEYKKGEREFVLNNGNKFERIKAKKLRAQDVIIVPGNTEMRELIQGLVSGKVPGRKPGRKQQLSIHVSTSHREEVTISGESLVCRLSEEVSSSPSKGARPGTPHSKKKRKHQGTSSRINPPKKTRKANTGRNLSITQQPQGNHRNLPLIRQRTNSRSLINFQRQ